MNQNLLDWYKKKGGYLHKDVIYKIVDGIGGMYATKNIPKGTIIAKNSPKITNDEEISDLNNSSSFLSDKNEKLTYYIAKKMEPNPWFDSLPTYSDYKSHHPFFLNKKTILKIKKYHVQFATAIETQKNIWNKMIDNILRFDSSLEKKHIIRCFLIVRTRSWMGDKSNYCMPIIDLFNHREGANRFNGNCFTVNKDIIAHDQIYISYGSKNFFELYNSYGFFDSTGSHFLQFHIIQTGQTPDDYKKIKELKNEYGGTFNIQNGNLQYISHESFAFENKFPNLKTIQYTMMKNNQNKFQTLHDIKKFLINKISKPYTIENIASLNPNDIEEKEIKEILLTYKKIIIGNLDWLKAEYEKIKLF